MTPTSKWVFSERLWNLGACPQRNFVLSRSLERQKMLLRVVGRFVYMTDLHSGMENVIRPSNLCFKNLKNSKFDL